MSWNVRIHVALMDVSSPVWRAVQAERVADTAYLVLEQPYDRDVERWQFEPGDLVECETISTKSGRILAAVRKADPDAL